MPKKVALLIGVTKCGDHLSPISEAANNVAAMQQVLQDPNSGGFNEVDSLINPNLEAMQKAIQIVLAKCGVNDLAVLFFSGQVIVDQDGHLYLTTSITTKDNFQKTALPASFLQQQLNNSSAERQVLILECCYTNALVEDLQIRNIGANISNDLGSKGRAVLTASSTTQTQVEQQGGELSPYTQYLIEGIETGAADRDGAGLIYVRELHNYAKEKVQNVKPQLEPNIFLDRTEFDILLTILLNQETQEDQEAEYQKIEAKYRKIVEQYDVDGEIPEIVRFTLNKKNREFGVTVDKNQPDSLISDCDIDYTKLRDLLKTGKWKEADQETLAVMLKAVNREQENFLDSEAIKNFPCTDLHTIDQLWVKYSGGQFGFSVQKSVWLSVGGELAEDNNEIYEAQLAGSLSTLNSNASPEDMVSQLHFRQTRLYEKFGLRVGWRDRNGVKLLRGWTSYDDLTFSLIWAPVGHLPTLASSRQTGFEEVNYWLLKSDFFSRMDACWL
ncbi:GUN4 domain-containing protein [Lyngbya aestuarii]|uniref:GUN4 domain-containing protein n=1 Tax=Lyngbya aestuarii TaxID=118322 RepID=UPI00403DB885